MSTQLYDEQIAGINMHLYKAATKHPKFCERLLNDGNVGEYVRFEKTCKDSCDKLPSAENILLEECSEVLNAIAKGDKAGAIDECYDTIAVLIRIIEEVTYNG